METYVSTIESRVNEIRASVPSTLFAEAVLSNIGTAVCITDSKGYFVDVNDEYCEFYGYSREQLIGQHFTIVVPEENRPFAAALHDSFIHGGEEPPALWTVQNARGELKRIYVTPVRFEDEKGGTSKMTLIEPLAD